MQYFFKIQHRVMLLYSLLFGPIISLRSWQDCFFAGGLSGGAAPDNYLNWALVGTVFNEGVWAPLRLNQGLR